MSRTSRWSLPLIMVLGGSALVYAGCTTDTGGPAAPEEASFKKGGVPAGDDVDPIVASVDPDSASQDTTLDVLVLGSGFDDGSEAVWLVSGTTEPDDRVRTNSTTYLNQRRLRANITIAADAQTTLYDVQVTTSKGRKGIGSEKFRVKEKLEPILVDASIEEDGNAIRSDGGGPYPAEIDQFGNLFLDARNTVVPLRKICFDFAGQLPADAGLPDVFCDAGWITTFDYSGGGGLQTMGLGGTRRVRLAVSWVMAGYNWSLTFGKDCLTDEILPDELDVATHPVPDTWIVSGVKATLCQLPVKGRPRYSKVGTSFDLPHRIALLRAAAP